jgi:hypothetical protein
MNDIKILIATHKECYLPQSDLFLPIQVGSELAKTKLPIQGDDQGTNISKKNPNYCELTAHFWAWQNLKNLDYIGLCHYRRYFKFDGCSILSKDKVPISTNKFKKLKFSKDIVIDIFKKYDIVLPKPVIYGFDLRFHYCYAHIFDEFEIMKNVIKEKFPDYMDSFNKILFNNNKFCQYNMFITKSEVFNDYSKWIFSVLFEVEKYVKISEYPFQLRVFGYMSERLIMVYCHHNKLKIKYLPVYLLDDANINNESFLKYKMRNFKNSILFYFSKIGSTN